MIAAGRRRRGFTLLEVMVALGILAAGLVAISEVVSGALRNQARVQRLEVATLLARAKMVQVQAELERKGFRDFDESEEGTFEADGHPEIRWKLDVVRPSLELGPDAVLAALSGGKTLQELLPPPDQAPQLAPFQAALGATIRAVLTRIGEQLKTGLREVRLQVSWTDGRTPESFEVVTHVAVLSPEAR
jgi:general secretion pathway protein I